MDSNKESLLLEVYATPLKRLVPTLSNLHQRQF